MPSKRVWRSAVARVLTQQQKKQSTDDSIAGLLLAQIQKGLSASNAAAMLAEKLRNSEKQLDRKSLKQVDLDAICAKIGLAVQYQPLTVDALLQETESGFLAIVNSLAKQSRQRKSLAHEIGHLMLYQATGLIQAFGHISPSERQNNESLEIEELCDCFASELIMPSTIWRHLISTEGLSLPTLKKLKDFYGVSIATASQRMVDISLFECAIIIWIPIYKDNVLIKLDPVRCWEKLTAGKKSQPQSLSLKQEFVVPGSPFHALEKQSMSKGVFSIILPGAKGKYLAYSDIIDKNYIITLLIPQHFGWEITMDKSKYKQASISE